LAISGASTSPPRSCPGEALLIRHGETEWSLSGQHTGNTDIPLTENGRRAAQRLGPYLAEQEFSLVLSSPLQRSLQTCELAGLGERVQIDPDLREWDYGAYEGLKPSEIHRQAPGWMIFQNGCPGGETPDQVAARTDRVIRRVREAGGRVALFAHGHVFRVLVARWIGLSPGEGCHFLLDTSTLTILSFYRDIPALKCWNAPLAEPIPQTQASRT